MKERCAWVGEDARYQVYHDTEWGVPQRDSRVLFEMLILEGFQAGLSWITILRKREGFRAAFDGFNPEKLATWGAKEADQLVLNTDIVRHRGKIEGVFKNARAWLEIEANEGFSTFIWDHVDGVPLQPNRAILSDVPAQTETSKRLSKNLKRAGFTFCGPTIAYAFMQAAGLVNDHVVTCFRHAEVARLS